MKKEKAPEEMRKIIIKKSDEKKDFAEILAHAITGGNYEEYVVKNGLLKQDDAV